MDISDVTAPPEGGKKILLFCEKVSREDIKVSFSVFILSAGLLKLYYMHQIWQNQRAALGFYSLHQKCYVFFQVKFSDGLGWEGWADFNPAEVHKQYGVAFKTPKYRDGNLKDMVKVFLELYKPSDESVSEPLDFFFVPQERILSPRQLAQARRIRMREKLFLDIWNI